MVLEQHIDHYNFPVGSKILVTHPSFKGQKWLYKVESKTENVLLKRISVLKDGQIIRFKNCFIQVGFEWFDKKTKREIKIVI